MNRIEDRSESDWEDRVVDRALSEVHGDRPPDLLAAIERRLQDSRGGDEHSDGTHGEPRRAMRTAAQWLAAASLLGLVLAFALRPLRTTGGDPQRFELSVVRGEVTLASAAWPLPPLRAGEAAIVTLAPGDRLGTDAHDASELRIAPFGAVRTEPTTVMEVLDMNVKAKNGIVTAGSLALAVVTGAVSWHWLDHRGQAQAGEVVRLDSESGVAAELAAARAATDKLQRENAALREELAGLQTASVRATAPAITTPPAAATAETPPATAETPTDAAKAAFPDDRFAELLASIDWATMGKVAGEMGIPLVELMRKIEAGEEVPMELRMQIAKLNMQLVEQLPKLMNSGLPGSPGNGTFTHPLVAGNQIAALLASGKLPLSQAQHDAIAGLVRRFTAEAAGIQDGPTELDIDRLVAEVTMKERMYDEFAQQLSPQQRAFLYPEGAGDYDGTSLFRAGVVWQSAAQPIAAGTPAAYTDATSQRLTESIGLEGEVAQQVRGIIEHAASRAGAQTWAASSPMERMEGARFMRNGRALRAAQLQQTWMRQILREVPLTPAQREKLRTMQRVMVPVPR